MAKEEYDIFHRQSTYKNAKGIFSAELPPIESVKDHCIYVLDTNALLVPFSTGSDSLEEIKKIYASLKANNQLLIPDQVAREFADNRPQKIGELFHAVSQKRDGINIPTIGVYPLLENLEEYKELRKIEKDLLEVAKKYRESITCVANVVKAWTWNDPVSEMYRELFTEEIIYELVFDKEVIQKELSYRYLHKIAPGYKDSGKEDEGIGDFLIWKTILEIGQKRNTNVVFVSSDEKSDWFHKSNKLPLYPKFELLAEFKTLCNSNSFHIIKLSQLLALKGADQNVVTEIEDEELSNHLNESIDHESAVKAAVIEFYHKKHNTIILNVNSNLFSFSYMHPGDQENIVFTVLLPRAYNISLYQFKEKMRMILNRLHFFVTPHIEIVVVAYNSKFAFDNFVSNVQKYIDELFFVRPHSELLIGYLSDSGEFECDRVFSSDKYV